MNNRIRKYFGTMRATNIEIYTTFSCHISDQTFKFRVQDYMSSKWILSVTTDNEIQCNILNLEHKPNNLTQLKELLKMNFLISRNKILGKLWRKIYCFNRYKSTLNGKKKKRAGKAWCKLWWKISIALFQVWRSGCNFWSLVAFRDSIFFLCHFFLYHGLFLHCLEHLLHLFLLFLDLHVHYDLRILVNWFEVIFDGSFLQFM